MTQPILLRNQYWGIEVPEGAKDFGWRPDCLTCIMPDSKPGTYKWLSNIDDWLRKQGGEWEVVGVSKEVTEEQAEDMVDTPSGFISLSYRNYEGGEWFDHALTSFRSLLRSKGLQINNTLILKKL